jgi:hypothetical protein
MLWQIYLWADRFCGTQFRLTHQQCSFSSPQATKCKMTAQRWLQAPGSGQKPAVLQEFHLGDNQGFRFTSDITDGNNNKIYKVTQKCESSLSNIYKQSRRSISTLQKPQHVPYTLKIYQFIGVLISIYHCSRKLLNNWCELFSLCTKILNNQETD